MFSVNIQSLNSKFNELNTLISDVKRNNSNLSLIALQEIWQVKHPDLFTIKGFKFYNSQRTKSKGGGVGFYINNDHPSKILHDLSSFHEKIFECLTVEVFINNKKFIMSNIYRSPSLIAENVNNFMEKFDNHLSKLDSVDCPYFLFLDSNINLLKLNSCNLSQKYIEMLHNNGFLQLVRKATRIQGENYSLIDHICVKNEPHSVKTGTIISDLSDHFINFISFPAVKKKTVPKTKGYFYDRQINKNSKEKFREALNNIQWNNVTCQDNVNTAYDEFWNTFSSLYDLYLPIVKIKLNRNIHKINGFMTKGLLISRSTKNIIHKRYLFDPSATNKTTYLNYRNIYNKLIRLSKKEYFADNLSKNKKNPKKTWEIYNEAINKKKPSEKIKEIVKNGKIITDNSEISEEFNEFFANIGQKIASSIPKIKKNPESYLSNKNDQPLFSFDDIGPVLICDILKSMDPKKSKDMDGISLDLLKSIDSAIAKPLAHVFNLSLKNGIFPDKLKVSRIVPIFKLGDKKLCDNYRPISLVSTIAKILEKIVATKLSNHLELNKLLHIHQFGFRKKLSTEHNLLHLTNYVSNALNEDDFCIGIFLDLKKAFDVVPHCILIKKLKKLGVKNKALDWFKSYLTNRSQCVDINGHISSPKNIDISVMQGSVLGPLLFLCFVNDLHTASKLFTLLFADDTCCLASGKNLIQLIQFCNEELQKIANWFSANKLAVNVGKCKFIFFHNKGKKLHFNGEKIVFNLNEIGEDDNPSNIIPLDRIYNDAASAENQTYKYLGILLDENLSFRAHIDYICKKLSKSLFCLRRAKSLLNERALRTLYFATFHSHLLYCANILGCASKSEMKRITILQKKAIRLITNSSYNSHTKPLFEKLKILPFDDILHEQKMIFMHSVYNNYAPVSFSNIWTKNNDREQQYELRNENNFLLPRPRFEGFKKYPLYSFAKTWNESGDLRLYSNPITFKIALRNQLLEQLVCED